MAAIFWGQKGNSASRHLRVQETKQVISAIISWGFEAIRNEAIFIHAKKFSRRNASSNSGGAMSERQHTRNRQELKGPGRIRVAKTGRCRAERAADRIDDRE